MKKVAVTPNRIAIVDDGDFEKVSGYSWNLHSQGYATAYVGGGRKKQAYVLMHHLVVGKNVETDHVNGNKLDNQRANLRQCSRSQNNANQRKTRGSSKFKGVRFHKQNRKWTAQIGFNKKSKYLGSFDTELEAARAYDVAAKELFGVFARLNLEAE